jgi:hypothetical protein
MTAVLITKATVTVIFGVVNISPKIRTSIKSATCFRLMESNNMLSR